MAKVGLVVMVEGIDILVSTNRGTPLNTPKPPCTKRERLLRSMDGYVVEF